jgi:hypothetical protein
LLLLLLLPLLLLLLLLLLPQPAPQALVPYPEISSHAMAFPDRKFNIPLHRAGHLTSLAELYVLRLTSHLTSAWVVEVITAASCCQHLCAAVALFSLQPNHKAVR